MFKGSGLEGNGPWVLFRAVSPAPKTRPGTEWVPRKDLLEEGRGGEGEKAVEGGSQRCWAGEGPRGGGGVAYKRWCDVHQQENEEGSPRLMKEVGSPLPPVAPQKPQTLGAHLPVWARRCENSTCVPDISIASDRDGGNDS